MKRIGLYGGSFNPPHVAHLVLAQEAADALCLDKVIFIPAKTPPHKSASDLANASDRLRMTRLATADNPRLSVTDMELRRPGRSYTIDTARIMRRRFGAGAELFFLIGEDTVPELPTWKDIAELVTLCAFVPFTRPGAPPPRMAALQKAIGRAEARAIRAHTVHMPLLEISATDIRRRVAEGRSIRYLAPSAVEGYIRRKGLYRNAATSEADSAQRPRCCEAASRRSSARRRRGRA